MANEPLWEPGTPAEARWFDGKVKEVIDGLEYLLIQAAKHRHGSCWVCNPKEPRPIPPTPEPTDEPQIPVTDTVEDEDPPDDEGLAGV